MQPGKRLVDGVRGAADFRGDLRHALPGPVAPLHEAKFALLELADAGPKRLVRSDDSQRASASVSAIDSIVSSLNRACARR